MSSDISRTLPAITLSEYGILPSMPSKKESLSAYLQRKLKETGLSSREVAKRGGFSSSYFRSLVLADQTNPSTKKMQALATGLGVPFQEIVDIVRGGGDARISLTDELHTILVSYEKLNEKDKDEIRPALLMFQREIDRRLNSKKR